MNMFQINMTMPKNHLLTLLDALDDQIGETLDEIYMLPDANIPPFHVEGVLNNLLWHHKKLVDLYNGFAECANLSQFEYVSQEEAKSIYLKSVRPKLQIVS